MSDQAVPVRAVDSCANVAREMGELLAVTGDDPDTLLMLIALCDRIIARREPAQISSASPTARAKIDTEILSGT